MLYKAISTIASSVPERRNLTLCAQLLGIVALATPKIGLLAQVLHPTWVHKVPAMAQLPGMDFWLKGGLWIPEVGIGLVFAALSTLVFSKLAVQKKWVTVRKASGRKELCITLGGMKFTEKALFTNLIAFGTIGAGKTSAVVFPILDAITRLYNNDDPKESDAKWGGFVLDVKGDFHEAVIYNMVKHNRDILSDLVVIRPDNDYYLLEFEEITTKEHFMVSCMGGTSMQECDLVLETAQGSPDILIISDDGQKVITLPSGQQEALSSYMFSDRGLFLRPEINNILGQLTFDVSGKSIRWLGWREDKNGRLVRVTHTFKRKTHYAKDSAGNLITTKKPSKLRYVGVHSINNGLTYNLIAKTSPAPEAAGRIMAVAEVTGNALGGDNQYWALASEKHIAACVELFRQVEGPNGKECSVNEIQRFTTNEKALREYVEKLKKVIHARQNIGAGEYEIVLLRNLQEYFEGEWLRLDPKTKGNIQSCVTNLFGDVTRSEQLLKTFCQPSKFSFEDCLNHGKVYTLVLSAYPNAQKLIGTCMKLDFQQIVLKRMQAAAVNKKRFLMFLADEYQFFITTSGGTKAGGDDQFLSISRQARIFNFVSTQSLSSLLAVQKDENKINAFLQCIGSRVFMQNLDKKTNELAEQTFGEVWREKTDFQGADLKITSAMDGGRSGSVTRRVEKQHRFDASWFTQLAPFEAVIFNKEEERKEKRIIKANLQKDKKFYDRDQVIKATNDYYQAYIENRAYELGISDLFNPVENVRVEDAAQKKARGGSLLRSWRNGMPVGLVIKPETGKGATVGVEQEEQPDIAAEESADVGNEFEETVMTKVTQALGGTPPQPEDLLGYIASDKCFFSDLVAAKNSDPFYNKEADSIEVHSPGVPLREELQTPASASSSEVLPVPTDEPVTPTNSIEAILSQDLPKEAPKGVKQVLVTKEKRRIMANLTTVPDGIQDKN